MNKDDIIFLTAGGGAVFVGIVLFVGITAAVAIVPAIIVTWAWNFIMPGIWAAAPHLLWWQTFILLMAMGIVGRLIRGKK